MKRVLLAIGAAAALVAACQVVVGIDRVAKVEAEAGASAGDAATDDPCVHVNAPDPPPVDDDKDLVIPPFWLAVREVSLTPQVPDGSYVGLDLDGVCTCDRRAGTASGGQSSCTAKADACDYDGGADNRAASLFQQFAATGSDINKGIVDDIAAGNSGLLVWISDWNGKPNDREVRIGIVVSTGVRTPGCGTTTSTDGEHYRPGWCGEDRWDYEPGKIIPINGVQQPLGNSTGYIVNGELVYRSPNAATLAVGGASIEFNSPISFGKIEAAEGGYRLTGVLGGRIEIKQLLGAIGQIQVVGKDACTLPDFQSVKAVLCDAVDITRTSVFDFQNAKCDAVSSAMRYTAFPAQLGNAVPRPRNPSPCAPEAPGNEGKYDCP